MPAEVQVIGLSLDRIISGFASNTVNIRKKMSGAGKYAV
jgi:hypothetical protein